MTTAPTPAVRAAAGTAGICCLTALRMSQLAQARVLASTLKRLHPGWHMVAALADPAPPGFELRAADEPFDEIVWGHTLHGNFAKPAWSSRSEAAHACTALKALALQRLLEAGHANVVLFDPGTAVLSPLTPLVGLLQVHPIVLVPQRLTADGAPAGGRSDGIFAPGCIAVRAGAEATRFATGWSQQLLRARPPQGSGGVPEWQGWLDRVPVLFDGVHILKDPGWHVSSHNLAERALAFDTSGRLLADGQPVRTLDVSALCEPGQPTAHDTTAFDVAAHDVLCWYRHAVLQHEEAAIAPDAWQVAAAAPAATPGGLPHRTPPLHQRPAAAPVAPGLVPTRYGPMQCFLDGDLISRFLRHYGEWAHFEALLLASLRPRRIFDIGAYLGTFSLALSASSPDFILAADANPQAFALLQANLSRNLRVPHAAVHAAVLEGDAPVTGAPALADNHGSFTLRAGVPGAFAPAIPTRTLAGLRGEFGGYDLLKLDVEGTEQEAIRSDAAWIAGHKPIIWAECNDHPRSLALFELLGGLGYDIHYYRFPAFNPANFHGRAERLVPVAFEAGLLAVPPGTAPQCPSEAAQAGAELLRVDSVESLQRAMWLTPRQGQEQWEHMSRTELLALLSRQLEGGTDSSMGATYRRVVAAILQGPDEKEAMSLAVGGQFEAIGELEYCILVQHGLHDEATVIDVGCGSGRLAFQLKDRFAGRYLGIDVVPELLAYAQRICARPDWIFREAPGLAIPAPDASADIVCFFSVFTHLLHEESFAYLKDAARVCKPGGRIIFSFLEFRLPSHWSMFEMALADLRRDKVLNQFMDRDAIGAWAQRLGLEVVGIFDGDAPCIDLGPVRPERGKGNLGQSFCVLTPRAGAQAGR